MSKIQETDYFSGGEIRWRCRIRDGRASCAGAEREKGCGRIVKHLGSFLLFRRGSRFLPGCSFALAVSVFCGIWNTQLDNGSVRPEMPCLPYCRPLSRSAGLDRRCSLIPSFLPAELASTCGSQFLDICVIHALPPTSTLHYSSLFLHSPILLFPDSLGILLQH